MSKYIVIKENELDPSDSIFNEPVLLWKNENTQEESTQYILRLTEQNAKQFRDRIKYTDNEIKIARKTYAYLVEKLESNVISRNMPFASKYLENGKSLFKRVHGMELSIAPNSIGFLDFTIPYPQVKFTGAELFGVSLGDQLDFFVLDSVNNDYSGQAGSYFMLNQFGFNVKMPDSRYANISNYDADIYQGMVVSCAYKNNTSTQKTVYINFELHEVK